MDFGEILRFRGKSGYEAGQISRLPSIGMYFKYICLSVWWDAFNIGIGKDVT